MSDSAEVSVRDNHKILLNFRTIVGEEENAKDWEIKDKSRITEKITFFLII